jgi:predicted SPOUT superfamily RNA methylase MTH1
MLEEYAQARSFLRQHLSDNINELDGAGVMVILKILSHLTNAMCKLVEKRG